MNKDTTTNTIIKKESDITSEFEKKYPNTVSAYKRWFKLKKIFKLLAYPVYGLFLYLSSFGTMFIILFFLMCLMLPLIAIQIKYNIPIIDSIFKNYFTFHIDFDYTDLFSISKLPDKIKYLFFIVPIIYLVVKKIINIILKKYFKFEFKLGLRKEMLLLSLSYLGIFLISFLITIILIPHLNIVWVYLFMLILVLPFVGYKFLMLLIVKSLKKFIESD